MPDSPIILTTSNEFACAEVGGGDCRVIVQLQDTNSSFSSFIVFLQVFVLNEANAGGRASDASQDANSNRLKRRLMPTLRYEK